MGVHCPKTRIEFLYDHGQRLAGIRGMETETIIVCEVALEAALDDYLPIESEILEGLEIKGRNRVFLGDRIRYLGELLNMQGEMLSDPIVAARKGLSLV